MMFDAMSVLFEPYFLFLTLFVPNLSDNHFHSAFSCRWEEGPIQMQGYEMGLFLGCTAPTSATGNRFLRTLAGA